MVDDVIKIEIRGLDKVLAGLNKFPQQIQKYLGWAGEESATKVIFPTPGLGASENSYPPIGPGNKPPTPYYYRGKGMQYKNYNTGSSERYGTRFTVEAQGYRTAIGNTASYAGYLGGEEQLGKMANIGWRKLFDVAKEKIDGITKVYQGWVDKLIKDVGL